MRALNSNPNVDNSNLVDYPFGRVKDNDGTGNGTGVNERVYGDLHQTIGQLMNLYGISPNGLPDNQTNGFQIIEALSALASKNDYIYPLTTDGTTFNVNIKLSSMKTNEFLVCLTAADKTSETLIKGIGVTTFAVTYSGNFKANEYVRVIKTNIGVTIVRIADWNSLTQMCIDAGFLQKASQAQEDAGTIDTKATTPLVNKTTFIKRVIGSDSGSYLATIARNGLYPKEHFAIVAGISASPVKNVGFFAGLDVGGSSGVLATGGNITSAVASLPGANNSIITVTMQHAMVGTNYYVRAFIQGQSSNIDDDNDVCAPVFKPISSTQFLVSFKEVSAPTQSLKVHLEVVQL